MKCAFAFLPLLAVFIVTARPALASDPLPRAMTADRYARMADRSPFAPPTAVAAVAAPTAPPPGPKWSDQLSVTGVTQQGGTFFATVLDKSTNERFLLQSNREDTGHQLEVASVQWGEKSDQTTVTLRHNNEFAAVRFEGGGAPAAVPAAPAVMPGRPLGAPGMFPAPGAPAPRNFFNPATAPAAVPSVVRRQAPIRTNPVSAAPARPAPNIVRRPLSNNKDDDDDD